MNFILLIVLLIPLLGLRFRKDNLTDYTNLTQTHAINGFFVMLVFLRHINQYLTIGKYDKYFSIFDSMIGQLIVTTFLFYSGYGVMYSIINKNNYINTIPKRILKILLQFDVAILFFIIVNLILGEHLTAIDIILSLLAWKSIGNSAWYIFAILCLYLFTFIAGKISPHKHNAIILIVCLCSILYILILHLCGKQTHWYNTVLCYPAGMFFASNLETFNSSIANKKSHQILSLFITCILFTICYKVDNHTIRLLSYQFAAIFFALGIVIFTTIFVVSNPILDWLGKHLFEIYILQRIPMLLLENMISNKYVYFAICFSITLLLAVIYKYIESYLSKLIDVLFSANTSNKEQLSSIK